MRPPRKRKTSRRLVIGTVSLFCAVALPLEVMAQGADCSLCVKVSCPDDWATFWKHKLEYVFPSIP